MTEPAVEPVVSGVASTKPPTPTSGTEYVVLTKEPSGRWLEISRLRATSGETAVKAALETEKEQDGTFVAIPARSFQPVTVKTKTVTSIVIEEAS